MITQVLKPDENSIDFAKQLLEKGEIVGVPTETVYGLAANAFNPVAVKRIFEAKGRPSDNPLILHISDINMLSEIAKNIPNIALKLAQKFWPGPLTMIFSKKEIVPRETNGGMDTVAVRMPSNKTTLNLIEKCGFPLAAPSANISGSPSPTLASHVLSDMNGKIPLILDGGACLCGVESTVIALSDDKIKILRPGAVTPEMLSAFGEVEIDSSVLSILESSQNPISPGMKYKHYSPKANVVIVDADSDQELFKFVENNKVKNTYALGFSSDTAMNLNTLSYGKSSEEQAANLFAKLRELDNLGADTVYVRSPSKNGVGLAVYNRLLRAAEFKVVNAKNYFKSG